MCIYSDHFRSLSTITAVALLIMTVGCASGGNTITSHESSITSVTVRMTDDKISSSLGLPGNAASGLLGGAARGFLYGMLNPAAWMMGGPLTTMTLEGARNASCGSALGNVNNPSGQLQELAGDMDLSQFRNKLESALHEMGATSHAKSGDTDLPGPSDTMLEIQEISLTLDSYMSDDEFVAECQPYLKANAKWRATTTDGQQIKEGKTVCSTSPSAKSFKDWFGDKPGTHDEIMWLLERLGWQVANDLIMENKNKYPC